MVVHLIPFDETESDRTFKHVRKMAMYPGYPLNSVEHNKGGVVNPTYLNTSQMYGEGPASAATRLQPSYDKLKTFHKDYRLGAAIQSTLNRPAEEIAKSNLATEMVTVSTDTRLDDDERVDKWLRLIRRHLLFKNETFPSTPSVTARLNPALQAISPEDQYVHEVQQQPQQNIVHGRPQAVPGAAPPGRAAAPLPPAFNLQSDDSSDYDTAESEVSDNEVTVRTERRHRMQSGYFRQLPNTRIIQDVNPPNKKNARALLNKIKHVIDGSKIGWSKDNEIVFKGRALAGSNMSEILENAVAKKPQLDIVGFNKFVKTMDKYKILGKNHLGSLKKTVGYYQPLKHNRSKIKKWQRMSAAN